MVLRGYPQVQIWVYRCLTIRWNGPWMKRDLIAKLYDVSR